MSGLTGLTKEQLEAHLEHLKVKHVEMAATYKRAVDLNESEDYTLRVKGDVESLEAMIAECELAIEAA